MGMNSLSLYQGFCFARLYNFVIFKVMRRLYLFIFFLLIIHYHGFAQIDTEFWFAPPEVTSGHGDSPVYLRISTQNQAATVRIFQPAKGSAELVSFLIAATTTQSVDLSNLISDLETNIPDAVMKTGIRIVSTAPITAYYEEASALNAEIFVLKGKNALGNNFIVPWQNIYDNSSDYRPLAYASFDVVATRNNTVVTVRPTQPIYGHEEDSIIVVKLNAGETYSFKKPTSSAFANPAGTIITSSKPIAVTIKDDSVIKETCRDLLGDQLIPVEVTGMEYIVPKGFLNAPEFLFITATEDNTEVFISGSNGPVARLNATESYRTEIRFSSVYIRSNKRIYVLHVTGFGCEVGMTVLPPINCTGSKDISFTRSTKEFFGMNVLVKKDGILYFKINGETSLLTGNQFKSVLGTNDEWYTAQVSYTDLQIPTGLASRISNDRYSFQAGIINGNASTSCRYGYFSSYSTLFIGDDFAICEGDSAIIDAGPGKESYVWSTGATTQSINVTDPGDYWVTVVTEDCILTDTIHMDVRKGMVDLGPDVELCPGGTTKIDGKDNFRWLWSDGTTGQYLETMQLGKYWVSIFDNIGCQASDTIEVKPYVSNIDPIVDIQLNYVSVDTAVQENVHVSWTIIHPEKIPGSIVSVFKRPSGVDDWEFVSDFSDQINSFLDDRNTTSEEIIEYYASLADRCGNEQKISLVHNTILLAGQADSVNDNINLQWNQYHEWVSGVDHYEVWRKLENSTSYKFVSVVDGAESTFSSQIAADGFKHQYAIRALEKQGAYESWSNPIKFELTHSITVPNVFTPNGDAYNQEFFIPKVELYNDSELFVFDRWGMKVYEAKGYKNDWDGHGLSSGVYYYVLDLKKNNKILKGIVSILK